MKISDDNILSDIMSDLDGSAPVLKPKPLAPAKSNSMASSNKEAQNYFKSLSTSVKKPTAVITSKEPAVTVKPEPEVN